MIVGVNTDVRHRGKTFHIQTEDSGPNNPVLVTHVFVGGSIIVTRRSEYTDLLNTAEWEDAVRDRMRTQHREVAEALQRGDFNDEIKHAGRGPGRADIPLARDTRSNQKKKGPKKAAKTPETPPLASPGLPPPVVDDGLPPPMTDAVAPGLDFPPPTMAPPPPGLAEDGLPEVDEGPQYQTPITDGAPLDAARLAWYLDDS